MKDNNQQKYFYNYQKRPILKPKVTVRPVAEGTVERLAACPEKKRLVEVRHMDIVYGSGFKKFRAVKDMSFNIYEGEVLGLVGESGSGKSTTGSALIGLVKYNFGEIKIADKVLPKQKERVSKQMRNFLVNNVQMIFQDPSNSLNPYKNIETVVAEGLNNLKDLKRGFLNVDYFIYRTNFLEFAQTLNQNNPVLDEIKAIFKEDAWDQTKEENQKLLRDLIAQIDQQASLPAKIDLEHLDQIFAEINETKDFSHNKLVKHIVLKSLKSVGLDETVLGRYPLEFSGGQQQRIGITRAITMRPRLLIADEPISALDVSIQAQVINIFKDLKEKYNLTILFIAHDLRMVEYISDRIAVMNKGTLLEIGPTKEIVNNFLHPYTKSLMEAVPSIESEKKSLLGYTYDPLAHNYTAELQPKWIHLGNDHWVLGTEEEVAKWKNKEY
ncbi:ABC transporter ATP-binding protein [Ureaplasma miroungigenitalium]|uniref:ABC transporter ATP-binding protein n=1 Tax=Ureaplasma miroungigenitalium TaxID=1042321 RepID=A0ABT3BMR5_9BACT|nr:ABC transporter ATP-binding protein [Ureaplasma miroungigenitalium]MCV3728540.1 ABC transporter ATP-binding protein [Ureaplasma miroungigenitalium]MCV3734453.1 ABC transporter ATP-binding protein [Ureaplasma miroungigenitalium]